ADPLVALGVMVGDARRRRPRLLRAADTAVDRPPGDRVDRRIPRAEAEVIVDAHNDLLHELAYRRAEERPFARHWLPLLEQGGVGIQVCPIYTADTVSADEALRLGLRAANASHRLRAEPPEPAVLVPTSR